MFEFIKRWKARRAQAEFERGFGFVMVEHHLRGKPSYYLWDVVLTGAAWDRTEFDKGAIAALQIIPQTELTDAGVGHG